jgi:hypothetical protein
LDLKTALSQLTPISLGEIEGAELMSRLDQKFLIRRTWIPSLLAQCKMDYRILEVDGQRQSEYANRFIETEECASLHSHTRGRKIRFKARIRQYGSNQRAFLEVKEKTVQGRTVKSRIERASEDGIKSDLTPSEWRFLEEHYAYDNPELAHMTCHFNRFTLVSKNQAERITIDTDIRFHTAGAEEGLGDICIMEVKQERIDRNSPLLQALEAFKFEYTPLGRRTSMSKYVVGMLLLNPNLPPRTYRSVMKRIRRLRENLN